MMAETIAADKGVAKKNVKICFFEQTLGNDIYAAGALIRESGSLVFLYDKAARRITQTENEFFPATVEELQALSIVAGRISPWTREVIVLVNFTRTDNAYSFKFYDGYLLLLSRWSYGYATVYIENEAVEWGAHVLEM
jgi:hypothetical protein